MIAQSSKPFGLLNKLLWSCCLLAASPSCHAAHIVPVGSREAPLLEKSDNEKGTSESSTAQKMLPPAALSATAVGLAVVASKRLKEEDTSTSIQSSSLPTKKPAGKGSEKNSAASEEETWEEDLRDSLTGSSNSASVSREDDETGSDASEDSESEEEEEVQVKEKKRTVAKRKLQAVGKKTIDGVKSVGRNMKRYIPFF